MSSADPENTLFEKQTLGLVKTLEKRTDICDIDLVCNPPVANSFITAWEQKHSCTVPDDVRSFFLVMNGLSLTWNVKINDIICIPVGRMVINPLEKLSKVTLDVASSSQDQASTSLDDFGIGTEESQTELLPKLDERSRIFELDPCDGYGKVCLVYRNTKAGTLAQSSDIWFLDRSLRFHFLANSFICYYRMMVAHLGLPQWQYAFTDIGLSTQAKQWFNLFCPVRLLINMQTYSPSFESNASKHSVQLDISKVFKGKTEKKKPITNQVIKKKPLLPSSVVKPGSGKVQINSAQTFKPTAK